MAERREAQQYRAAVMGFMASFGAGASKAADGNSPYGPSHVVSKFHMLSYIFLWFHTRHYVNMFISSKQQAPDGYGPNVDTGYGTHTDASNDDEHTPMSLYSLYGDINDDSV